MLHFYKKTCGKIWRILKFIFSLPLKIIDKIERVFACNWFSATTKKTDFIISSSKCSHPSIKGVGFLCSNKRALVGLRELWRKFAPFLFATLLNNQKTNIVALYQVTVKKQWFSAGQVIEPGMSVQVSSMMIADPILINGGQLVRDAFLRIYGVDLQQINALNGLILESKRIG